MTFVGMARFELATSSSRTKRATGLRYIPSVIFGLQIYKKFETQHSFSGEFFLPKSKRRTSTSLTDHDYFQKNILC